MKLRYKILIIIGVILIVLGAVVAYMFSQMRAQSNNEDPTYWFDDIVEIEERYQEDTDVDIVFIGSSSIRKWETLEEDFSDYDVVNHGFGGSKVQDSTYYYDRLVTPFTPDLIVLFAGTNDIHGTSDNSKTGEEVFDLFVGFYEKSKLENPDVPVIYISITPTPMRFGVWEEANTANNLIERYAEGESNLYYIDAVDVFLSNGEPNDDFFIFDGLHLNDEGYTEWVNLIKPVVDQILK